MLLFLLKRLSLFLPQISDNLHQIISNTDDQQLVKAFKAKCLSCFNSILRANIFNPFFVQSCINILNGKKKFDKDQTIASLMTSTAYCSDTPQEDKDSSKDDDDYDNDKDVEEPRSKNFKTVENEVESPNSKSSENDDLDGEPMDRPVFSSLVDYKSDDGSENLSSTGGAENYASLNQTSSGFKSSGWKAISATEVEVDNTLSSSIWEKANDNSQNVQESAINSDDYDDDDLDGE